MLELGTKSRYVPSMQSIPIFRLSLLCLLTLTLALFPRLSVCAEDHPAPASAEGEGSAEAPAEAPEKKKKKSSLLSKEEQEALDEQRIEHSLKNLGASRSMIFEQSVFFFEQMGTAAVPRLVKYFQENKGNRKLRKDIVYTLGRIGPKAKTALPIMIPMLKEEDSDYRVTVVVAIGKLGPEAKNAVPELIGLLSDPDPLVRGKTEEALLRIGGDEARAAVKAYREAQKAAVVPPVEKAVH